MPIDRTNHPILDVVGEVISPAPFQNASHFNSEIGVTPCLAPSDGFWPRVTHAVDDRTVVFGYYDDVITYLEAIPEFTRMDIVQVFIIEEVAIKANYQLI